MIVVKDNYNRISLVNDTQDLLKFENAQARAWYVMLRWPSGYSSIHIKRWFPFMDIYLITSFIVLCFPFTGTSNEFWYPQVSLMLYYLLNWKKLYSITRCFQSSWLPWSRWILFLFYLYFWALASQLSLTLHPQCICRSLMFSCTKLCTTTEFMSLFSHPLGKSTVNYVLLFIVCLPTCNILYSNSLFILKWILKSHILCHGGLSRL